VPAGFSAVRPDMARYWAADRDVATCPPAPVPPGL
jgi:hypothetical protein